MSTTRTRFVALFDCSPADPPPWVKAACADTGLLWVDNEKVIAEMSKSPEYQAAVLQQGFRESEANAPYYSAALDKVALGHDRIAVYSVSWFLYGVRPAVAVLDFQPLEDEVKKARLGPKKYTEEYLADRLRIFRAKLTDQALAHVGQERTLIIPPGTDESRKGALAAEHIKRFAPSPTDPNFKFKGGVRG